MFSGITKNPLFIAIVFGILGLQIVLVTFAGSAFHAYQNYGLTPIQWLLSISFGSLSMPINFILKFKTLKEPTDDGELIEKELR